MIDSSWLDVRTKNIPQARCGECRHYTSDNDCGADNDPDLDGTQRPTGIWYGPIDATALRRCHRFSTIENDRRRRVAAAALTGIRDALGVAIK